MIMNYDVPGSVDNVSKEIRENWNQRIQSEFESQQPISSRFLVADPASIPGALPVDTARWPGNAAEPEFCRNADVARKLSDWEERGRHFIQNEYAEYHITFGFDEDGNRRPKRVEVTTELREYWLTLAVLDPEKLQEAAEEVLGRSVPFSELYGPDVTNPASLSPQQRQNRFVRFLGGTGGGGTGKPAGSLNNDNALFMWHGINGLDDLIFVVAFGSFPRRVIQGGVARKAQMFEIFQHESQVHLACRHADPAAAAAAHEAAWEGRSFAFANPLGVYIRSFAQDSFTFNGNALPAHWVTFSRGGDAPGFAQRLVFGPPDDEPFFLDQITLSIGGSDRQVSGGYDVVTQIEVGPPLVATQPSPLQESDFTTVPAFSGVDCREAAVCARIRQLEEELSMLGTFTRSGPRIMGGNQ
jgi:hypothetical protein